MLSYKGALIRPVLLDALQILAMVRHRIPCPYDGTVYGTVTDRPSGLLTFAHSPGARLQKLYPDLSK